ncbi:MAG: hypothetical protein U1E97_01530 [Alphaproteobacteria bacterium]
MRGDGVVGEQPVLRPGNPSAIQAERRHKSPSGIMEGFHEMHSASGEQFRPRTRRFPIARTCQGACIEGPLRRPGQAGSER